MGSKNEELGKRFYDFALRIIRLVRKLPKEIAANEIGRQLLRSGTSIAANYEEATGAFSREDFTYKLSIAFKETKETTLWLRLLRDSGISGDEIGDIIKESEEIRNILGKSVKTAKENR
ncbi:MAG: four helix bundle protein [Deltaproteobacteria bacterium]|nr:four helix bundle protein [Deltaproteobacteria bacterium]